MRELVILCTRIAGSNRSKAPLLFLLAAIAALAGGCSSTPRPARLGFQTIEGGRGFAQSFPRAYFAKTDDGDSDVILIDDGYPPQSDSSSGPIKPVAAFPLRQVMHFKLLWDPPHGTQADAPSTTNTLIDWLVETTSRAGGSDSLRYQGAGFVLSSASSTRLTLFIRNATIQSTRHTGNLIDPIGRCAMSGSFTAVRNDQLVKATLAEMRQDQTPGEPSQASATMGGPPPRMPAGP